MLNLKPPLAQTTLPVHQALSGVQSIAMTPAISDSYAWFVSVSPMITLLELFGKAYGTTSCHLGTLDQIVTVDARADGCERCVLEPRCNTLLELFCDSAPHICEGIEGQH